MSTTFQLFPDLEKCSIVLAEIILRTALKAVSEKGFFTFVLAGGETPKTLYKTLAAEPFCKKMPWEKTYLFFSDERLVPHDHHNSNYLMVKNSLIDNISIPAKNVLAVPTDIPTPSAVAVSYEKTIKRVFEENSGEKIDAYHFPCFDFILLGMGEDGHTASLFPGTFAIKVKDFIVTSLTPPQGVTPALKRITLTFPAINNGDNVYFLVSGDKKRKILEEIIAAPEEAKDKYPAARVNPKGKLIWFASKK